MPILKTLLLETNKQTTTETEIEGKKKEIQTQRYLLACIYSLSPFALGMLVEYFHTFQIKQQNLLHLNHLSMKGNDYSIHLVHLSGTVILC